jgi:hypothetical protein
MVEGWAPSAPRAAPRGPGPVLAPSDRVRVRKLSTRLVVGGADPVVETREVVYLGEQERVRVRRGDTLVLERWTTHVSDGERRVATLDRHVVDTLGAEVDALGPTQVRYHLTTPQGSTAVELAADGRLITYEEYLPHGGSAFLAGDDAREVARRDVQEDRNGVVSEGRQAAAPSAGLSQLLGSEESPWSHRAGARRSCLRCPERGERIRCRDQEQ